jgi:hypothetical protein
MQAPLFLRDKISCFYDLKNSIGGKRLFPWRAVMLEAVKTKLWLQVAVAMALGLAVGFPLSPTGAGLLALETAESTGP